MNLRTAAFIVFGLGEALFAGLGIFTATGHGRFDALSQYVLPFPLFMTTMFLLSLTTTCLYVFNRLSRLNVFVSALLATQWMMLFLSPFFVDSYSISSPLYLTMFMVRMLMTVIIEMENKLTHE